MRKIPGNFAVPHFMGQCTCPKFAGTARDSARLNISFASAERVPNRCGTGWDNRHRMTVPRTESLSSVHVGHPNRQGHIASGQWKGRKQKPRFDHYAPAYAREATLDTENVPKKSLR